MTRIYILEYHMFIYFTTVLVSIPDSVPSSFFSYILRSTNKIVYVEQNVLASIILKIMNFLWPPK